jgi:hypothetical protein
LQLEISWNLEVEARQARSILIVKQAKAGAYTVACPCYQLSSDSATTSRWLVPCGLLQRRRKKLTTCFEIGAGTVQSQMSVMTELEPLDCVKRQFQALSPLHLQFFMPRLIDKPQDPIMDTLKLLKDLQLPPVTGSRTLPTELLAGSYLPPLSIPSTSEDDFWINALRKGDVDLVRALFPDRRSISVCDSAEDPDQVLG